MSNRRRGALDDEAVVNPPPLEVESPAGLARTLGVPVSAVLRAIRELEAAPALVVDERTYYAAPVARSVAERLGVRFTSESRQRVIVDRAEGAGS